MPARCVVRTSVVHVVMQSCTLRHQGGWQARAPARERTCRAFRARAGAASPRCPCSSARSGMSEHLAREGRPPRLPAASAMSCVFLEKFKFVRYAERGCCSSIYRYNVLILSLYFYSSAWYINRCWLNEVTVFYCPPPGRSIRHRCRLVQCSRLQ